MEKIQDITNQVLDAIEKGRPRSAEKYYADNFKFTGPMSQAQDKEQYISTMEKITQGVTGWNFNRHDIRVDANTVMVPVRISGTHTRTLPSLGPGMPDLPASNRSFHLANEVIRVIFQGDRISEMHVDPVAGGGVSGMLEQLGMQIPISGQTDKPVA
jgi:hypothetical protein